ncbi:spore germination protein [Pueribacillus sp. YX66]|uniref:spore germination protein n=1 Tax=Pueribacillus sp. YX66 TaxID=3229242 RepID=UPI00358D63EC
MPSIVGPVKIVEVGGSSVVNFGDSFYNSPKATSKTYAGSGSFNTGDFLNTTSGVSATNTTDPDVLDTGQTGTT